MGQISKGEAVAQCSDGLIEISDELAKLVEKARRLLHSLEAITFDEDLYEIESAISTAREGWLVGLREVNESIAGTAAELNEITGSLSE